MPAMPTQEYSSAWKTFWISREAITLPAVARRSPAMTTPPGKVSATIVVPCGASKGSGPPGAPSAAARRPGRYSGL